MLKRDYGKSKNYKITIIKCFIEKVKKAKKKKKIFTRITTVTKTFKKYNKVDMIQTKTDKIGK